MSDVELLEVGEGPGVKPALRLGAEVAGAAAVEGEPACGAMVLGDYLGDGEGWDAGGGGDGASDAWGVGC